MTTLSRKTGGLY